MLSRHSAAKILNQTRSKCKLALSSAVFWSFAATAVRFGGLVLVLPITIRLLPSQELGLWYVFLSIGGLATLLELGYAQTLTRSVGYLWVGAASLVPKGVLPSPEGERRTNYEALSTLLATMTSLYIAIGLIVILLLSSVGSYWIETKVSSLDCANSLRLAWIMYSLSVGLNMTGTLWPAALIGINGVRTSQQIFLSALLANYTVTVIGLFSGLGLWAVIAGNFIQAFVIQQVGRLMFLRRAGSEFLKARGKVEMGLVKTLWPQSWRTALVGLGTFMITQSNTLICGKFLGLETTASYGLTLQMISAISGVSATWVIVKVPTFNHLRARGEVHELSRLLVSRVRYSIASYLGLSAGFVLLGPLAISLIGSNTPLLPLSVTLIMLLFYFLESHHSFHAFSVLSENQNPFVFPALLSGIAIVLASYLLTPIFGVLGMIFSFGIIQMSFNNWWIVQRNLTSLGSNWSCYLRSLFGIGKL